VEVIAYYRVSTDEQAASGLGLEAQRAAVTTAAVTRGWTIAAEYTDLARSGKNTNRPALAEALEHAERTGGTVMVSKLARLSRSVGDFARMADRARRRGWSIVALDVDVDTIVARMEAEDAASGNVSTPKMRAKAAATEAKGVKQEAHKALSDAKQGLKKVEADEARLLKATEARRRLKKDATSKTAAKQAAARVRLLGVNCCMGILNLRRA
jgi:DNA invertase Pin-like site-specific DNA recombinase